MVSKCLLVFLCDIVNLRNLIVRLCRFLNGFKDSMKSERTLLKVVALLASKDKDNYMLERRKDKNIPKTSIGLRWNGELNHYSRS